MLEHALAAIAPQVDKLIGYEQKLAARIEQFRTEKEVMKTTYTAAQAQVKVTQSITGVGDRLSGVGDSMQRAEDKMLGMRDKADAMDGLIQSGVLATTRSTTAPPPSVNWPRSGRPTRWTRSCSN